MYVPGVPWNGHLTGGLTRISALKEHKMKPELKRRRIQKESEQRDGVERKRMRRKEERVPNIRNQPPRTATTRKPQSLLAKTRRVLKTQHL
ncbi:hypothetical protein NDU88_004356 [Pleurodeles waltl]|uniref:Uncharacterized protein n=1 Tax=Pleurodeles waltl TaxID=8319 RepID=A0AAV7NM04_PLEWA|nr:hypothetical protein NDU88_004356 [Pleurodeles waltl]